MSKQRGDRRRGFSVSEMPVVSAQPFLFTLLSPFPSLALSAEGEWAVQDLNL